MTTQRITAIVCTCRRHGLLGDCLAALDAQTLTRDAFEIVVVDNSVDATAIAAFDWPARVRLVTAERAGLSHARNLGLAAAAAPIAAFIDDDAQAAPDWLAAILRAADAHPQAGAVGGRVVPVWPQPRPDWLDASHDGFLSIVDHGARARALDAREWLAGTNIAFRRDAAIRAGGFAEHLGRFPEPCSATRKSRCWPACARPGMRCATIRRSWCVTASRPSGSTAPGCAAGWPGRRSPT